MSEFRWGWGYGLQLNTASTMSDRAKLAADLLNCVDDLLVVAFNLSREPSSIAQASGKCGQEGRKAR